MTGMTKDDFPLLAEVFSEFQTVYMPARNLAQKTRQQVGQILAGACQRVGQVRDGMI